MRQAVRLWRRFPVEGSPRTHRILATMTCPTCGADFSIGSAVHSIADNGDVFPSMVCPYPPCAFHAFIALEGWADDSPTSASPSFVGDDDATARGGS